jgi:ATP adenylyltransferase
MDHLWSPWRLKYIYGHERSDACVFCTAPAQPDGPGSLVVARGEHVFTILNRYPYTSGHLMVVPYAHLPTLEDLDTPTRTEMMEMVNRAMCVIRAEYRAEGFNLGANIGAAAGAGIAAHVHFHIVPRWLGDTNFMSTVGETRILPEELEETWRRISTAWTAVS